MELANRRGYRPASYFHLLMDEQFERAALGRLFRSVGARTEAMGDPDFWGSSSVMHYGTSSALREFDRWSRSYDRSLLQKLFFGPSHRLLLKQMTPADQRVLDIGCGTGLFAVRVLQHFREARVWGFDLSSKMLERGCDTFQTCPHNDGRLHLVRGDSERLPFRDNTFDVITCSHSFHHYPDQANAVAEMHRVLRPGGRLMIVDGDRDGWWGWLIFDVIVTLAEGAVHHCSQERFKKLYRQAGFGAVRHHCRGGPLPFVLTVGHALKPAVTHSLPLVHAA
jgi:ubiquinone/menaquinone biosynthesis C-methylase UbiE